MRYYIESDGRLFLVRRGDHFDLPSPDEIPFEVERIAPLDLDASIWFCMPRLEGHPHDWPSKDEVQDRPDVAPRVVQAVHATMPRVVCEAVCIESGRLLLVRGNRGFTKDRWTLPGGFVRFGEHPADGLQREIQEELGVEAEVGECLSVRSKLGERSRLHWILFFYRAELCGTPKANPDEIAAIRFVDRASAAALLSDSAMSGLVKDLPENAWESAI